MVIDTIHKNDMFKIYKHYSARFGIPCIVHATREKSFLSILQRRKMSNIAPKDIDYKRVGQLETEYEMGKCIWFSIGFLYNAQLDDDYGFIFNPSVIDKNFEVFNYFIMSLLHKEIIRYWRDKDSQYLKQVMEKTGKAIIQSFLESDKKGNANDFGNFPWWEIKEKLYIFYDDYPKKAMLKKHLMKIRTEDKIISGQKKYVQDMYNKRMITRGEIVSHKEIYLDTTHLIGFFIKKGRLNKKVIQAINKFVGSTKHVDKQRLVIFDGDRKIPYNKVLSL